MPYATTPARLLAQLISDIVVAVWIAIWVLVGMAVHSAVATIADFGSDVESGANGIAGNLDSAGENADKVPLIGDALSKPLTAAGGFARDIAGAGHQLNTTASWLAWLLALAVAAPPIMAIAVPWLVLRLRFFRRKWVALTLASDAGGRTAARAAGAGQPAAGQACGDQRRPRRGVAARGRGGDQRPGRAGTASRRRRPPHPSHISDFGALTGAQRTASAPQIASTGTNVGLQRVNHECSTNFYANRTAC